MKKRLRIFATLLSGAVLVFVASSCLVAQYLIGPVPSKVVWPTVTQFTPENVNFSATDGISLKGWFLPVPNSKTAVLLLHGVDANRQTMLQRALWLHELGYNVFLYDARGCGESEPVNRSFGYAETRDLIGALHWLQSRGISQIGCIGCSQGAATILLASGQLPPEVSAIVAEASYATLRNTTDDHFRIHTGLPSCYFGALVVPIDEWRLGLNMDDVSPLQQIRKLKAPVYLIGGTADELAPPAGVHELYDAAPGEKYLWMVPWAGHADFFSYDNKEYKRRIGDFLRKHLTLSLGAP